MNIKDNLLNIIIVVLLVCILYNSLKERTITIYFTDTKKSLYLKV